MALPLSMRAPHNFLFPSVPGRPFRVISIETEVDGVGDSIAQELFTCGIVAQNRVQSYGSHPGEEHRCIAFMKTDSSVSAGEVVFDRIILEQPTHAKALNLAMAKMRQMEKRGMTAYNPNCGGHIHVDAMGFGFYDLLRLMMEFGYLEEPIFRLAGSGKQYGHRSLYRGYDAAHRQYSNPVIKGPFTDPVVAMRQFRGQNRNVGLNITKYLGNRCRTGACNLLPIDDTENVINNEAEDQLQRAIRVYRTNYGGDPNEDWIQAEREYLYSQYAGTGTYIDLKECTCPQKQHTIEWRVWNAQSNPRILYAWIAFMQALHAYTWRPSDSMAYREHIYKEELGWARKPFDKGDRAFHYKVKERLEFIFCELPLLAEEKDALAYAFMRTPYRIWGKDFFKRLANQPYKPPPVPNWYTPIRSRMIADVDEAVIEPDTNTDWRSMRRPPTQFPLEGEEIDF